MFTSQGNIRRKRKTPRLPPNSTSDRMVMKRLRDERIRRADADERNLNALDPENRDHVGWNDNNQNPPADDDEVNQIYNHWQRNRDVGEKTADLDNLDDNDSDSDDSDDVDDDSDDDDDNDIDNDDNDDNDR